jgi:hypothetical protein
MTSSGRLRDLYATPPSTAPAWVGDGVLVKGGLMLAGGPPKIGKSWLAVNAADQLSRGEALWGTWPVPAEVPTLYIDRELGIYGYHERVKQFYDATGRRPNSNLFYLSKPPGMFLDTARGLDLLRKEIDRTGARVVIIDPVARSMIGEENSNTAVAHLFSNLDELVAADPDLSIILFHHFGKPPKGDYATDFDPLDPMNFRGAATWFAAPDSLLTFARENGRDGEWWRVKCRAVLRHGKDSEDRTFAIGDGGIVSPRMAEAAGRKTWARR